MFDIEGFREAEAFESGAESLGAHAAACYYFGRRLYTAVNESTTFEVQGSAICDDSQVCAKPPLNYPILP